MSQLNGVLESLEWESTFFARPSAIVRLRDDAPALQASDFAAWPRVREQIDIDIKTADLRYASGFALTPADASVLQQPVAPAARKGRK